METDLYWYHQGKRGPGPCRNQEGGPLCHKKCNNTENEYLVKGKNRQDLSGHFSPCRNMQGALFLLGISCMCKCVKYNQDCITLSGG